MSQKRNQLPEGSNLGFLFGDFNSRSDAQPLIPENYL